MKQGKIFLQSVLLLFCLTALLTGCDNGDDNDSTGGTSVLSSSEASTGDLKSYLTTAINDEYRAKKVQISIEPPRGYVVDGEVYPPADLEIAILRSAGG
ncbi:MAG: hypothetical protein D3921_16555, partial [Candidatus Electrothrix sp. AW1]|nr:hypothetical protein [Candidatus Electrothrix gigas]